MKGKKWILAVVLLATIAMAVGCRLFVGKEDVLEPVEYDEEKYLSIDAEVMNIFTISDDWWTVDEDFQI